MTRNTNARVAGFTYLAYIALAFPSLLLSARATQGDGVAAKLASIAAHAGAMRVAIVLTLITCFAAIVLAVTLYALTRDEDRDLALVAFACRVGEGFASAIVMRTMVEQLWLGTTGSVSLDAAATQALGTLLFTGTRAWNSSVAATFFAVGSTLFCWLLFRGRIIPTALACLGVVGSILLVVCLPLQLAGLLHRPITDLMWLPIAAFEIPLGVWWLIKGDTTRRAAVAAPIAITPKES